ncbi:MAG: hypothetical protein JJU11_15415 [Candidatus Sumerlaeia bacterium]|nr:hypothetical protein [Candidatus Sumerlaeia bacterium]
MIELKKNELVFSFPEVHRHARLTIHFQRTLRLPDNGESYPLPPGLGSFPLRHVDDHRDAVPAEWVRRGGVMMPIYQSEAMWINFNAPHDYPFMVMIAAGKINAVNGEIWNPKPTAVPNQNYLAVPQQPWLDGFVVGGGKVRQFVAMPLGAGYTAEEQLTGAAEHGGVQIAVRPLKAKYWEDSTADSDIMLQCAFDSVYSMGLAPGGLMEQEIYEDEWNVDQYEETAGSRCFVHLLNSTQWKAVTGKEPPGKPPTARDYTAAGMPWFDYYREDAKAVAGNERLEGLKSVSRMAREGGDRKVLLDHDDGLFPIDRVVSLRDGRKKPVVRDGNW